MNRLMKSLGQSAVAILALGATAAIGHAEIKLQGAGATFPNPIYQKWVTEYQKSHPDTKIDYQSIAPAEASRASPKRPSTSPAPTHHEQEGNGGRRRQHRPHPTVAGSVVAAYNIPGVSGELKLTGPVLADIYMGKISKWNDPQIVQINDGIQMPELAITPAYRTDGSGTSFVFTNYLSTQSEAFTSSIGMGKQVKWPVGQGGKGNEGVAAVVQQTPGAIGYIELNYAVANHINFALLQNKNGKFVKASRKRWRRPVRARFCR